MAKRKIKDMLREAEEAVKNASPEGDAKAIAESRVAFLKEMQSEGFTVNQDHINDVVAAETQRVNGEWETVVGSGLDDTREYMASLTEADLENLAEGSSDGSGEGSQDGDPEANANANVLKLLSERDRKISDLEGRYEDSVKKNTEFQKKILTGRLESSFRDVLKSKGMQEKYIDPAKRMAGFDALVQEAMDGNEPDADRFAEIADDLQKQTPPWFSPERDPNLQSVGTTPDARDVPALTDEMRAAQSASVF